MPDLTVVPGVGRRTAAKLARLGIHDTDGLLLHLPRRYLDLRPVPVREILRPKKAASVAASRRPGEPASGRATGSESRGTGLPKGRAALTGAGPASDSPAGPGADPEGLDAGEWVTVKGCVTQAGVRKTKRKGLWLAEAELVDDTGALRLVWFFQWPYRGEPKPPVKAGAACVATGRVERTIAGVVLRDAIIHPEPPVERYFPIYPLTEGVTQSRMRSWIHWALENAAPEETLPPALLERAKAPPIGRALWMAHRPSAPDDPEKGRRRFALGELYAYFEQAESERRRAAQGAAVPCPESLIPIDEFAGKLPFSLTAGQRRALVELSRDLARDRPMRRLLSGDVGSGKTVVAAYGALRAVLAGGQALFLAPTRLLAEQHQRTVRSLLSPWGIRVELFAAGMDEKDRRRVAEAAAGGEPMVIAGTHALLSPGFSVPKAYFGVIDEQHRFGVEQRESLDPGYRMHVLAMSATPIPRTLAMALFAEMDVTFLDERPPGRRPVDTRWIHPDRRADLYAFVRRQVGLGRQAYVVCPRVNPETGEEDDGAAAEAFAAKLASTWLSGVRVGLVHGRMSPREQEEAMRAFVEGRIDVLVSTTVIEVGVDVPNASVMVIERAELFGLAQLHQLRGRVGRGAHQGYCLLVADPKTESALLRVNVLRRCDDGRRIAEIDLATRGPGEFLGLRQSGRSDFRFVDFARDAPLVEAVRQWRAQDRRNSV